jgi:hypothetical protein
MSTEDEIKISLKEIGDTGVKVSGGRYDEEYNSRLKGEEGRKIFDRMRKHDGKISGHLKIITDLIRSATFHVKPAGSDPESKRIADASWFMLNSMNITFDDFIRQILLMLPFGFMPFNWWVADKEFPKEFGEAKYSISVSPRLPSSIVKWETSKGKEGIVQRMSNGKEIDIPIESLIVFTHRKEGDNYEGVSILRPMYRSWFYKEVLYKIQALQAEFHSKAIPIGSVPEGTPPESEAYKKFDTLLKKFTVTQGGYLIKFSGWDINILDMKSRDIIDISKAIEMHDDEISEAFALQFLGIHNLSGDAIDEISQLFYLSISSTVSYICEVINKRIIKTFCDLNFNDIGIYPELSFGKIGNTNLKAFAQAIRHLFYSGAVTYDKPTEEFIRKDFNLPPVSEEGRGESIVGSPIENKETNGQGKDSIKDEEIEEDNSDDKEDDTNDVTDDSKKNENNMASSFENKLNIFVNRAFDSIICGEDKNIIISKLFSDCFNLGKNKIFDEKGSKSIKTPNIVKKSITNRTNKILANGGNFLDMLKSNAIYFYENGIDFANTI